MLKSILRVPLGVVLLFAGILSSQAFSADGGFCVPERIREFLSTFSRKGAGQLAEGPSESQAFVRRGTVLRGRFRPQVDGLEITEVGEQSLLLKPTSGRTVNLGGVDYLEFPNSTALQTRDPKTGKVREFLVTRGVRPYTNRVRADGSQSPKGYVSDVLLFERDSASRKFVFRSTLLRSAPEKIFFFEDPRISVVYDESGMPHYLLSGTDYSPHVPGATDPDVMNRYLELALDDRGMPLPVEIDAATAKPAFRNLSPFPKRSANGTGYVFVDAKNATIARNELGQIVVRLRLRPDFNHRDIRALAGGRSWKYAEQVFVFKDWSAMERYDWGFALEDLFQPEAHLHASGRERPMVAKVLLTDRDLVEQFGDSNVVPEKGKGLGPGTPPVRVRREGDRLYVSESKGASEHFAGAVPKEVLDRLLIPDGEVRYIAFDHEIRYFKVLGFIKRHYTLSIKVFDPTLTQIEAYYADVVQPTRGYERGVTAGIVDLLHVYPMGRTIHAQSPSQAATVRVFCGVSDAHTAQYDFNLASLFVEMARGSARWKSGQVYRP